MITRNLKLCFVFIAVLGLSACQVTNDYSHHTIKSNQDRPLKILVMPVEVEINTLTAAGDLELQVDETGQAEQSIMDSFHAKLKRGNIELITMPELTMGEQALVDEHTALYDTVGGAAISFAQMFKHKKDRFDYTLGEGLGFLVERSGADAALFVNAYNTNSSGGRVAAAIFAAAWGVAIPMGQDIAFASVVDLKTGNILWLGQPSVGNLQNPQGVQKFTNAVLTGYKKTFAPE